MKCVTCKEPLDDDDDEMLCCEYCRGTFHLHQSAAIDDYCGIDSIHRTLCRGCHEEMQQGDYDQRKLDIERGK